MSEAVKEDQYLSVVLSGGIALGSYHAGVMAQLGWFLAQWEARCKANPDLPTIFVDVVSGASAGALTGAMLFQYVGTGYYSTGSGGGKEEYLKLNYNAWCGPELRFQNLLGQATKDKDQSILSNGVIAGLTTRSIAGDAETKLPLGQDRLILTCTATSLDPIPFPILLPDATDPSKKTKQFYGTTRRDWTTFQITSPDKVPSRFGTSGAYKNLTYQNPDCVFMELASVPDNMNTTANLAKLWERVRSFAMASGAFPLAWSPMQIQRRLQFYPSPFRGKATPTDVTPMRYMDGGVMDNMPLDRAASVIRDFAMWTDCSAGITQRTYLLIDVSPVTPADPAKIASSPAAPIRLSADSPVSEVGPMIEAVREQGYFRDLQAASAVNTRLDNRKAYLWPVLQKHAADLAAADLPKALQEAESNALKLMMGRYHASTADSQAALSMLRAQYEARNPGFAGTLTGNRQDLFVYTVIIADFVADLPGRHHFEALRVQPLRDLKGAFFGDFGGFVDQTLMRDDFWHGMTTAQAQLTKWVQELVPGEVQTDLFCPYETFAGVAGCSNLSQAEIESYYTGSGPAFSWPDAPARGQKIFIKSILMRANKISGGITGIVAWIGGKFSTSIAVIALLAIMIGTIWAAKNGHATIAAILGVATGLLLPTVLIASFLWPKVVGLMPKAK